MAKGIKLTKAQRKALKHRLAATGACAITVISMGTNCINVYAAQNTTSNIGMEQQTSTPLLSSAAPQEGTYKKIDISTLNTTNGERICEISTDGTYLLTGTNYIENANNEGGSYIPTSIKVKEGVKATLYLDGVSINNKNGTVIPSSVAPMYEPPKEYDATLPIGIESGAEVTIELLNDSTFSVNDNGVAFEVAENALVILEPSSHSLTITKELDNGSKDKDYDMNLYGTFVMNGSHLVSGNKKHDCQFKFNDNTGKMIINGGSFELYSHEMLYKKDSHFHFEINGGMFNSNCMSLNYISTYNKNSLHNIVSISGLTPNTEVSMCYQYYKNKEEIREYISNGITTDESGNIYIDIGQHNLKLDPDKGNFEILLKCGDKYYKASYTDEANETNHCMEAQEYSDTDSYTIKIDGAYTGSFENVAFGTKLEDLVNDGKTYVFIAKNPSQACTIVDGLNTEFTAYEIKKDEAQGKYYEIADTDSLKSFATIVNSGVSDINGKLTADIDASSISDFIIGDSLAHAYRGTFYGNGHTITMKVEETGKSEGTSLFGYLGNGAEIRNIMTKGEIESSGRFCGGIASKINGLCTIENCGSSIAFTYTNPGSSRSCVYGGIVGSIESGNVQITNCMFTGSIAAQQGYDPLEDQGGLVGQRQNSANLNISNCFVAAHFSGGSGENFVKTSKDAELNNCYYLNACGSSTQGTKISSEQFASAELAYKLNTCNGTKTNSGVFTYVAGKDYPEFAAGEYKAVSKVTFADDEKDSEYAVAWADGYSVYTDCNGHVMLPNVSTYLDYDDRALWYYGENVVDSNTVFETDTKLELVIQYNKEKRKAKLQGIYDACTAKADDEMKYTTASYADFSAAMAETEALLKLEESACTVDMITTCLDNLNTATDGLIKATGILSVKSENGEGTVPGGAGRYAAGDTVQLNAPESEGRKFVGWYKGDKLVSEMPEYSFEFNDSGNVEYTAKYRDMYQSSDKEHSSGNTETNTPGTSDSGNTGSNTSGSGNTGSNTSGSGNTGSNTSDSGNTGSNTSDNGNRGNTEGGSISNSDTNKDNTGNTGNIGNTDDTKANDEQMAKAEEKVEILKGRFGDDVKIVGSSVTINDAVSGKKTKGAFFDNEGNKLTNSFVTGANGKTYYTDANGKAVRKALVTDGNKTYYCGKYGNVLKNTAIKLADGSRILASKSGAIVTKSKAKVVVNGKTYITGKNGVLACKQIIKAKDGKKYYGNKYGIVVTGKKITLNGKRYKADENGVLSSATK